MASRCACLSHLIVSAFFVIGIIIFVIFFLSVFLHLVCFDALQKVFNKFIGDLVIHRINYALVYCDIYLIFLKTILHDFFLFYFACTLSSHLHNVYRTKKRIDIARANKYLLKLCHINLLTKKILTNKI